MVRSEVFPPAALALRSGARTRPSAQGTAGRPEHQGLSLNILNENVKENHVNFNFELEYIEHLRVLECRMQPLPLSVLQCLDPPSTVAQPGARRRAGPSHRVVV